MGHSPVRFATVLIATGLLAAGVGPARAADAPAAVVRTATLRIVARLKVNPLLPNGTAVAASGSISVADSAYSNYAQISGETKVSGGMADISLSVPVEWKLSSAAEKFTVSLNLSGSIGVTYLSTSLSAEQAVPKQGATATVNFAGTL